MRFMNKVDYETQRNAAMVEAKKLMDEGKLAEAEVKMADVEKMDNDWANDAQELANQRVLEDRLTSLGANAMGLDNRGEKINMSENINSNVLTDEKIYENAFAKTLLNLEMNKDEKALFDKVNKEAELTNAMTTTGVSAVIPTTLMKGIWQEMQEAHPILNQLTPTYIQGEVEYNKEDVEIDDASWEDETDEAVSDDKTFIGTIKLTGCELDKVVTVKWKLKKMGLEEFLIYIQNKLSQKMGNALAKAVLKGKGKPGEGDDWKAQPVGVITSLTKESGTPQIVTYATDLDYTDFTKTRGKVKSNYSNGLVWFMKSKTLWDEVANVLDGQMRPMFIPNPVESKTIGYILGIPVMEEDGLADGEILLGNFKSTYKINFNDIAHMYIEDHAKKKETDYMEYAIVDGAPITTKAYALLKKQ